MTATATTTTTARQVQKDGEKMEMTVEKGSSAGKMEVGLVGKIEKAIRYYGKFSRNGRSARPVSRLMDGFDCSLQNTPRNAMHRQPGQTPEKSRGTDGVGGGRDFKRR